MKWGRVYRNGVFVGLISKDSGGYSFVYDRAYLADREMLAISPSFPLQKEPFRSEKLFAFFANMLAEGSTRALQCKMLGIDENDLFTRLLKTTSEAIGAITVEEAK